MKFSLIMPTKNRHEYIKEALEAILLQGVDLEVIVVDDGDKPEIPNDSRIKYVRGDGTGITGAMNKGLQMATGDVYMEANDDDVLCRFSLEKIEKALEESGAKWGYGLIERGGSTYGSPWSMRDMMQHNIVPQPAAFWTREAMELVGVMDPENDLVSDYEYWLRLGSVYEPVFINEVLAFYREWEGQLTKTASAKQLEQAQNVRRKYA